MKQTLIVFYSRSGYTRRIAQQLALALDADLEEIVETRPRTGVAGYLRSLIDTVRGRTVPIAPPQRSARDYETVVIGTPVWAGRVSAPVRAWLALHAAELHRVAFFCTCGGSGADKVLREAAVLCGREPAATLALTDREIDRQETAKPERFIRTVAVHPA